MDVIYDYPNNLDNLQRIVNNAVRVLRRHAIECPFDSIVVRGVSGLLVGTPVALRLKKPLIVVRKASEKSHDDRDVINRDRIGERWLFLDDFISTGTTWRLCQDAIRDVAPRARVHFDVRTHMRGRHGTDQSKTIELGIAPGARNVATYEYRGKGLWIEVDERGQWREVDESDE